MQQRVKLQLELEQLTPVPINDLEQAADLLENFRLHWEKLKGKPEAQHELIKLIVERAYVRDDMVVAMTLRSNFHLVLGHNVNGPTYLQVDPLYSYGSDGYRSLTCIKLVIIFLPKHIVQQQLSQRLPYTNSLSYSQQLAESLVFRLMQVTKEA
jgi:hypothetical protein